MIRSSLPYLSRSDYISHAIDAIVVQEGTFSFNYLSCAGLNMLNQAREFNESVL